MMERSLMLAFHHNDHWQGLLPMVVMQLLQFKNNEKILMKKIKAIFELISTLFNVILNKSSCDKQLYDLLKDEFNKNLHHQELTLAIKRVFPSGGNKLIKNLNNYENAKRFQTRMNHISHFMMDIESLEQDGILKMYIKSMDNLDKTIEEEIKDRVRSLKESGKNRPGTIKSDLSKIKVKRLREIYEKEIKA